MKDKSKDGAKLCCGGDESYGVRVKMVCWRVEMLFICEMLFSKFVFPNVHRKNQFLLKFLTKDREEI